MRCLTVPAKTVRKYTSNGPQMPKRFPNRYLTTYVSKSQTVGEMPRIANHLVRHLNITDYLLGVSIAKSLVSRLPIKTFDRRVK